MTVTNPHPLANPLTDRPIGNMNWQRLAASGYFRSASSMKKSGQQLQLPDSTFSYEDFCKAQEQFHVPQQDEPMQMSLDMRGYGKMWDDREIMRLDVPTEMQGMSADDIEYQRRSEEENKKLSAQMDDFQKDLLAHVEDFTGKSKLIEESKKDEDPKATDGLL